MNYYPIFLDLRSKPVLVVGGGKVATRKVKGLLEAQAHVTVVAPVISNDLRETAAITLVEREYQSCDCPGHALIFAATSSREVNAQIARDARAQSIPSNVADAPEECAFIVPARLSDGIIQIAVSTGGTDPRRAVAIRDSIRRALPAILSV